MLPKQVTDLTENFVRVFDAERPAVIEFRKAQNQGAAPYLQQGATMMYSAIIPIGKNLTAYLEDRDRLIWGKLQEIITSTEKESYPDLSSDLKSQIGTYCNPSHEAAERFIEQLRVSHNVPTGYTVETKWAFANIISRINAEVDLFCAKYATNKQRDVQSAAGQVINVGNLHGIIGNVTGSQVTMQEGVVQSDSLAWKQHRLERAKFRHQLYEPRLAIFNSTMTLLSVVISKADVQLTDLFKFLQETNQSDFLLGKDIADYLEEIYKKGVELHKQEKMIHNSNLPDEERMRIIDQNTELLIWFGQQVLVARQKFVPYLRLDD